MSKERDIKLSRHDVLDVIGNKPWKQSEKIGSNMFQTNDWNASNYTMFFAFDLGNIGGCYASLMMFIEGGDVSKVGFYST